MPRSEHSLSALQLDSCIAIEAIKIAGRPVCCAYLSKLEEDHSLSFTSCKNQKKKECLNYSHFQIRLACLEGRVAGGQGFIETQRENIFQHNSRRCPTIVVVESAVEEIHGAVRP